MADDVIYTEPVYTERSDAGIANPPTVENDLKSNIQVSVVAPR